MYQTTFYRADEVNVAKTRTVFNRNGVNLTEEAALLEGIYSRIVVVAERANVV